MSVLRPLVAVNGQRTATKPTNRTKSPSMTQQISGDDSSDTTVPSWRHLNEKITDGALYPYLLRLSVLTYRTQPRFRTGGTSDSTNGSNNTFLTPGDNTISPVKSHSRKNSAHDLRISPQTTHSTQASSSPPNFSSKLPKEIPKLLQNKFNGIALKLDTKYASIDPLLRRSYLAFYALLLSPEFAKQVKENRRAEDLVMMFLSCVAKELNKSAVAHQEAKILVDQQAASFVRLLIDTLKDGGLASSSQSLISQLQSYELSLKSSTALSVMTSKGHGHSASFSGEAAVAPQVPTFEVENMSLTQDIGKLLLVANSEMQRDVNAAKTLATERRAISEIRLLANNLRDYNQHLAYQQFDFDTESAWSEWKSFELDQIEQQIALYSSVRAGLTNVPAATEEMYFIPPDVKSYYRHLLKRCLERDFKVSGKELASNPDSVTILLSKASREILTKAAHLWRVPHVTTAVLILHVAQEMFSEGTFEVSTLADAFNLARHIATVDEKKHAVTWVPNSWPKSDKVLFATSLKGIHDTVIEKLAGCLSLIYENSPPKMGPYLELLEVHILAEDHMKGFADIEPSPRQVTKLETVIISAAEKKYDQLIDDIPRDHTLDPLHVIDLADKLIGIAKRLQKRYKFALLGQISIGHLSAERHLTLFSADSQSMFSHLMSHMQARNEEPSFEDMIILYKKLAEIRDLHSQISKIPFQFDIEGAFYPYVLKWAESSSSLAQTWVDPAVKSDNFLPVNEDINQMWSSSVTDVFSSFRSALSMLEDLGWRSDTHRARIISILIKGVSGATCHYAQRIFELFFAELHEHGTEEEQHYKTRQDKWIAMAKNAVNSKSIKIPPPYSFLKQTCVKLNDMEVAQAELDKIENDVDSEKISNIIAMKDRQSRRPNGYLFTVKIVQAENLKACDMNGLSDPYVTLVDQQSRKQIGKTRTIYEELDPYWDEAFEIATTGAKWLTATVWDENSISNHDLCGRAFIRLDPNAFQDFISQDYWLDLDTQGKLLVNISMESERDDIRFHFGKAFRTLARAETDMVRMIVEKFTAFIKYSISSTTLKQLQGIGRFNVNMDAVSNWLSNTRIGGGNKEQKGHRLTQTEIEDSLNPLFDYLNENFATLAQGLTDDMRLKVMTQTWKVVLRTIESLLLPSLSDKRTSQQQLPATEADIVFTWLSTMRDFFHHDGAGPSLEVLQSQKYQELMTVPVYYDLSTTELKQESEKMSSLSFKSLQERTYFTIPEMIKRKNTVMAHRNRKALKKQNEQIRNAKRESPQTEDIILRILRARGEVEYVARRLKQRERIAQTLATESMVRKAAQGGFKRDDF